MVWVPRGSDLWEMARKYIQETNGRYRLFQKGLFVLVPGEMSVLLWNRKGKDREPFLQLLFLSCLHCKIFNTEMWHRLRWYFLILLHTHHSLQNHSEPGKGNPWKKICRETTQANFCCLAF
jgi:hypothetical protein